MGTGYGKGDRRAIEAAEMAINSPLLEDVAIDGAQGILVNITGGPDLGMLEVSEAVAMIESAAHEDAHIIFGYVTLDEPCDEVKITVIATGFGNEESQTGIARQSSIKVPLSARSGYNAGSRVSSNAPASTMRTSSEIPDQVQITPSVRVSSSAGHRVSASANSANLDIPAFIRKINGND
jgi:cell division protein FtsZ